MAEKREVTIAIPKIDKDAIKQKASQIGNAVGDKAEDIKQLTLDTKEDIMNKITELDNMLSEEINKYNDAYTLMNDKGTQLFVERSKAADNLRYIELLVNSIANHPKSFDSDFEEINTNRKEFLKVCDYADKELLAARKAAGGAGAGFAAASAVAFMGPTAAMWVATTFGTASTGAAISSLSGAAATNAALAWLGGGALAAGGQGVVAGNALLAMAGPIGWSIAGATLLTSIVLFASKRTKLNKEKNEEIESVKKNTEAIKEMDAGISELLNTTIKFSDNLYAEYEKCFCLSGKDYAGFNDEEKTSLGNLVNCAKSLSAMFGKTIASEG